MQCMHKEALFVAQSCDKHACAHAWVSGDRYVLRLFGDHTLTGGPGSPFSPGGPASSENWVGSRSNVWKPSVAARVTGISEVGLTSCTLVTFGSGFFEAIVVNCFLWGG